MTSIPTRSSCSFFLCWFSWKCKILEVSCYFHFFFLNLFLNSSGSWETKILWEMQTWRKIEFGISLKVQLPRNYTGCKLPRYCWVAKSASLWYINLMFFIIVLSIIENENGIQHLKFDRFIASSCPYYTSPFHTRIRYLLQKWIISLR